MWRLGKLLPLVELLLKTEDFNLQPRDNPDNKHNPDNKLPSSIFNMRFFHAIFVIAFALTATCMTIKLQDEANNIEKRASWSSLGCYTDNVSGRALTTSGVVPGGSSAMTNEACQTACSAAGFSYAGTEYAGECCKSFIFLFLAQLHITYSY